MPGRPSPEIAYEFVRCDFPEKVPVEGVLVHALTDVQSCNVIQDVVQSGGELLGLVPDKDCRHFAMIVELLAS